MYFIRLLLFLLCTTPIHSLDFNIPLPNTLILAGTSSLVTWRGMGNATAINLYLGNGPSKDQLKVISIFGQNIPSSKKSIWITMPKDAPNDNTYLILEGNDSPPSRATVPLNIGFGSKTTPSAVPTGHSSSSSSSMVHPSSSRSSSSVHSSSSSSSSVRPSSSITSSSAASSHATSKPTGKPSSHSDSDASSTPFSSDSTTVTSSPSSSSSSSGSGANLSSGQTAGVTVGVIGAVGLAVGAFFFVRRNRRSDKRSTDIFEGEAYGVTPRPLPPMNDGFYNGYNQPQYGLPPPPVAYDSPSSSSGYPRSFGHTQSPYYSINPVHDTHQNGFQSSTEANAHYGSPGVLHKPDEIHLSDAPNKPHSP